MGCGVYWQQVRQTENALGLLREEGFGPGDPAYDALWRRRGRQLAEVGYKFPRVPDIMMPTVFLSPQSIRLWHDPEAGWMVEVREKPGTPPMYKSVSDKVAMAVLKKELTPELKAELFKPVEYYGE